jgi:signal transduction histidine kinase
MSETVAKSTFPPIGDRNGPEIGDLADLVHELNNPLFAILGHIEFALRDAEPGSEIEERMRIIQRTGFEIKEILRSTLEASRRRAS